LPTVSASLSVDKTDVYVGDTLTFSGSATINGQPFSGAQVWILILLEEKGPEGWTVIINGYTKTDGSFSLTWTVPSKVAGIDITNSSRRFKAYILKQINTEVYWEYSNEVTVYIHTTPLPVEVKIVEAKIRDVTTGEEFDIYKGEPAFVTYHLAIDEELFDVYVKLRNITDHEITATLDLGELGLSYSIRLSPNEEWGGWKWTVSPPKVPPLAITFKAWSEGGAVDAITFTLDQGNFLWINSELPSKVEISGEIKAEFVERGLYIFPHNAPVSLYAIPPFCHVFQKWRIDSTDHYENPVSFSMEANHTATAYFEPAT